MDFSFAYTGASGGLLAGCRLLHETIAFAEVVDADGRQLTAMTFEAEQYRQLLAHGQQVSGPARITALGTDVSVYPDAEAFAASPGSQIHPPPGTAPEPPPQYDGPWPPRLAAESFISFGLFADIARNRSRARLSGTVLDANPPRQRAHRAVLHRRRRPHRRIRGRPVPCRQRAPGHARTRQHHQRHRLPVRRHRRPPPERRTSMNGEEPSGDDEDLEPVPFIFMAAGETFDGQERMFSRAAYNLQVLATGHSAPCGHPGFAPDDYLEHLDGLGIETTITAAELCALGTWERAGGGYRVLDREAVKYALDQVRQDNGEDPRSPHRGARPRDQGPGPPG